MLTCFLPESWIELSYLKRGHFRLAAPRNIAVSLKLPSSWHTCFLCEQGSTSDRCCLAWSVCLLAGSLVLCFPALSQRPAPGETHPVGDLVCPGEDHVCGGDTAARRVRESLVWWNQCRCKFGGDRNMASFLVAFGETHPHLSRSPWFHRHTLPLTCCRIVLFSLFS